MSELPDETVSPELLNPWFIEFTNHTSEIIKAECLHHRSNGFIILEFLRTKAAPAADWEDELLRSGIISELIKPEALNELAEASTRLIRDMTGFDRVMIYKFREHKQAKQLFGAPLSRIRYSRNGTAALYAQCYALDPRYQRRWRAHYQAIW